MEKRTERAAASAHPFTPRPPPAARPFCLFGLGGWLKTLQNKQPSGYVSYAAFRSRGWRQPSGFNLYNAFSKGGGSGLLPGAGIGILHLTFLT